jgi:hypothetical protein
MSRSKITQLLFALLFLLLFCLPFVLNFFCYKSMPAGPLLARALVVAVRAASTAGPSTVVVRVFFSGETKRGQRGKSAYGHA